jgi:PAS domain S-box-containing protein
VPRKKHPIKADDARWLQLLIDSIVDYAIYTIDVQGRVASWNSGAARLKGYSVEEMIGEPFAKFFTAEDQARELPREALGTAARAGRFETEGWRVRADGTRFWALAVIDAVRDRDGKLVGFAHLTRDMTDRRLEQTRLLETERRFRELVQAREKASNRCVSVAARWAPRIAFAIERGRRLCDLSAGQGWHRNDLERRGRTHQGLHR